jgi:hypothetical protein
VQLELSIVVDHGVAGVVPALKSNHPFGVAGQGIDNPTLTFVTVLGSHNNDY